MEFMHQQGWEVMGIDFSREGISHWNPDMTPFFLQGNIYKLLDDINATHKHYNIIHLGNVIEHVLDPENLLLKIKEVLSSDGILIIVAPNDFSQLQNHLLLNNYVDEKYFLAYPDHISYFNKESMSMFLTELGYNIIEIISDFPIEFNLLTESTNYVKNKNIGKSVHRQRIKFENMLFEQDPQILIDIYRALGKNGLGRNLIYYCTK